MRSSEGISTRSESETVKRNHFAMAALSSGLIQEHIPEYKLTALFGGRGGITREEIMAAQAYAIADAMIERSKL